MACRYEHSGLETCAQCEFEPFVRNNYFTGKLMTAADFIDEQTYNREKQRHHNARLHGSGVVCGLRVHEHPSADCRKRYVVVEPGSAIDCCGHEILVPDAETVDVAQHSAVLEKTNDGALHTLQLVACYRECPTEEVPVLYDDCGCDDTQCAANRILESYAFDVLVDPPLADGLGGAAALGAFVTSNTHGATGWIQASVAGKVAIVDPGDGTTSAGAGQRAFILDVAHRSLITIDLPAKARAIAMARDGGHVFVVVDPFGGATTCQVLVFDAADGTEVTPGSPRTVPGIGSTTPISAATTTDANRLLVVLDGATGKLYRWKADSSTVIVDAPAAAITFSKGGSLAAADDGSTLYAIDTASKVQVLDMTSGSPTPTPLTGLPAGRTPSAIAAFTLGTTDMLAVGSGSSKTVDIVDPSGAASVETVNVAQPPVYLGVTGTAAAPWINVYEEQAGHGYVQAIALDAAAAGSQPSVSAPRAAGDGPARVIVVHADGQASVVDPGQFADSDCADVLDKQASCPDCDVPECVVLATIAGYRPGSSLLDMATEQDDLSKAIARIDLRAGRRTLASTATLQAWLECLQLKGGVPGPKGDQGPKGEKGDPGDPGDPGAGITGVEVTTGECGTQATATIDNGVLKLTIPRGCDGEDGGPGLVEVSIQTGDCDTPASATLENGVLRIVIPGCCTPDLTRICAINWQHSGAYDDPRGDLIVAFDGEIDPADIGRHSFVVETNEPSLVDEQRQLWVDCWCQLVGEYRPVRLAEPCVIDNEDPGRPVTAMAFRPSPGFIEGREYRVRVLGDLIRDATGKRAVDANHLPPWLPDRPTGDCVEGGTFHSWFTAKG